MGTAKKANPMTPQEAGRLGGLFHKEKDPDYFKKLGKRGGKVFAKKMQDPDFRDDHIRRSRLGKEFGVNHNG